MDLNGAKKVNLDLNTALVLYKHYKDYVLPFGVILISVFVFIFVVIPEIKQYFSSQEELKIEQEKLDILKNNYNFLSNIDDVKSENDLKALSYVLPPTKDFAGIMTSISTAAQKTGASVGEFEFSLGDLAKSSDGQIANPSIQIKVGVGGSPALVIQFIDELYKTAPISDVISIKASKALANLTILFYYKSFPVQVVSDDKPIVPFSAQTISLIETVSDWNNSTAQPFVPLIPDLDSTTSGTFISSSSAGSNSSPF